MPTELATQIAIYEADEQERRAKQAKCIADFVASQPGPRNIPSGSKEGSENRHGEDTASAAGDDDDNFRERSEFVKQWKGIRFSRDKVEELLKKEPACNRCLRLQIPCNIVKAKLICKECQMAKVVCPRKFDNMLRVLAQKLEKSEEEVRSRHTRYMTSSIRKGKGRKGDDEVANSKAKAKAKKNEVNETGKAKGKGKKKEQLPKIIIPGGRGSKSNETRSERSNSRAPCDEELDELEMDVNVPGTSKPVDTPGVSTPQFRCLDLQGPDAKNNQKANEEILASKIAVDVPEPSESQPQHSQVPHADDTRLANEDDDSMEMHVDTAALLTPKSSCFHSDTPLCLKRKMWDDLSREGLYEYLEAYEAQVQQVVNQRLDAEVQLSELRRKMEELAEERDAALHKAQEVSETLQELRAAQWEVRQVENQGVNAKLELSELRRKVEALAEERDELLEERNRLRDLAEDQRYDDGASDRHRHSSLGERPNLPDENQSQIAVLKAVIATHNRLFDQEKNQRKELENEVACLRFELGKANLSSHLLSEYGAFAREVRTTAYALEAVEDLVSRKTDFQCEDFRAMIRSLSEASTSAKERISTIAHGKHTIVSFIREDTDYDEWRSPYPSEEKRGKKRKEREDDHDDPESRAGPVRWRDES